MKKAVWGWLYPLRDELKPIVPFFDLLPQCPSSPRRDGLLSRFPINELKKDEYIVGKDSSSSYVLTESHFDKQIFKELSKKQFKIQKKKDGIYLEDIGGTYVNDKKVGEGKKVPLVHNSYIAVAKINIKVFAFLEKANSDAAAIALPKEINENYHQSRKLGAGGFGEVSLVFEKDTGRRFALKIVKKHRDILKYTRTEAEIMRKISHPCIVMTEQVIDNLSLSAMFIVMEYMDGGNLLQRIYPYKSLNEGNMKLIFFQLVQAIQCLHQHNYVHRDIKPENVLLASRTTDPLVKVTDFGVSKILRPGTVMDTRVGTPMYIAPEMENRQQEYTKQVDVWSMGVLLYFCLSGSFPFGKDANVSKTVVSYPALKWFRISKDAIALVNAMLQPIPTLRITVDDILKHSWLQDTSMRKQAHRLMWPDKPYGKSPTKRAVAASPRVVAASPKAAAASPRASFSSQFRGIQPRGVLQYQNVYAKPHGDTRDKINDKQPLLRANLPQNQPAKASVPVIPPPGVRENAAKNQAVRPSNMQPQAVRANVIQPAGVRGNVAQNQAFRTSREYVVQSREVRENRVGSPLVLGKQPMLNKK